MLHKEPSTVGCLLVAVMYISTYSTYPTCTAEELEERCIFLQVQERE